jgi:hypothetical protein
MPADTQHDFPSTVADWRFQQLQQAGWPETDALLLAERPEIDLHLACELLEEGCDLGTAWRILR